MPAIRHATRFGRKKAPPEGYLEIEPELLILENEMKDAVNTPSTTGPRHRNTWKITQITHKRTKFVWDLYCDEKITKEVYDYCVKMGLVDALLVAKWKKEGYEKLCCLKCIQTNETNFNSTCICRVPKADLKEDQDNPCVSCGCIGCASSD